MTYPFNVRSFFTDRETKDIGSGIQLWRGYFQSVRPGMGQMLINIDISTATMYKSGRLIDICLEVLRKNNPSALSNLTDRDFLKLNKFISGVRVLTKAPGDGRPARVVKRLTRNSARNEEFALRGGGGKATVAEYFHKAFNRPLQFPDLFCVEVSLALSIESDFAQQNRRSDQVQRYLSNSAPSLLAKSCANKSRQRRPKMCLTSPRRGQLTAYRVSQMV